MYLQVLLIKKKLKLFILQLKLLKHNDIIIFIYLYIINYVTKNVKIFLK